MRCNISNKDIFGLDMKLIASKANEYVAWQVFLATTGSTQVQLLVFSKSSPPKQERFSWEACSTLEKLENITIALECGTLWQLIIESQIHLSREGGSESYSIWYKWRPAGIYTELLLLLGEEWMTWPVSRTSGSYGRGMSPPAQSTEVKSSCAMKGTETKLYMQINCNTEVTVCAFYVIVILLVWEQQVLNCHDQG